MFAVTEPLRQGGREVGFVDDVDDVAAVEHAPRLPPAELHDHALADTRSRKSRAALRRRSWTLRPTRPARMVAFLYAYAQLAARDKLSAHGLLLLPENKTARPVPFGTTPRMSFRGV